MTTLRFFKILSYSLILCALPSCKEAEEQPTLSREKTAAIIADIFIADAAVATGYGPVRDSMQAWYYKQVFELHGIDRDSFEHQLSLYSRSLTEMDTIMHMAETKLKNEN